MRKREDKKNIFYCYSLWQLLYFIVLIKAENLKHNILFVTPYGATEEIVENISKTNIFEKIKISFGSSFNNIFIEELRFISKDDIENNNFDMHKIDDILEKIENDYAEKFEEYKTEKLYLAGDFGFASFYFIKNYKNITVLEDGYGVYERIISTVGKGENANELQSKLNLMRKKKILPEALGFSDSVSEILINSNIPENIPLKIKQKIIVKNLYKMLNRNKNECVDVFKTIFPISIDSHKTYSIIATQPLYSNALKYLEFPAYKNFLLIKKLLEGDFKKEKNILIKPHPGDSLNYDMFASENITVLPQKMPLEMLSFFLPDDKINRSASINSTASLSKNIKIEKLISDKKTRSQEKFKRSLKKLVKNERINLHVFFCMKNKTKFNAKCVESFRGDKIFNIKIDFLKKSDISLINESDLSGDDYFIVLKGGNPFDNIKNIFLKVLDNNLPNALIFNRGNFVSKNNAQAFPAYREYYKINHDCVKGINNIIFSVKMLPHLKKKDVNDVLFDSAFSKNVFRSKVAIRTGIRKSHVLKSFKLKKKIKKILLPIKKTLFKKECSVSVIIPTYKKQNFLDECIDSCLNQKKFGIKIDIEILLCVNGGDKEYFNYLTAKYKKNRKIKVLFTNEKGTHAGRYLGFQNISKKWFTFLDDDDYFSRNLFCNSVSFMKESIKMVSFGVMRKRNDSLYQDGFGFYLKKLSGGTFLDLKKIIRSPFLTCGHFFNTKELHDVIDFSLECKNPLAPEDLEFAYKNFDEKLCPFSVIRISETGGNYIYRASADSKAVVNIFSDDYKKRYLAKLEAHVYLYNYINDYLKSERRSEDKIEFLFYISKSNMRRDFQYFQTKNDFEYREDFLRMLDKIKSNDFRDMLNIHGQDFFNGIFFMPSQNNEMHLLSYKRLLSITKYIKSAVKFSVVLLSQEKKIKDMATKKFGKLCFDFMAEINEMLIYKKISTGSQYLVYSNNALGSHKKAIDICKKYKMRYFAELSCRFGELEDKETLEEIACYAEKIFFSDAHEIERILSLTSNPELRNSISKKSTVLKLDETEPAFFDLL